MPPKSAFMRSTSLSSSRLTVFATEESFAFRARSRCSRALRCGELSRLGGFSTSWPVGDGVRELLPPRSLNRPRPFRASCTRLARSDISTTTCPGPAAVEPEPPAPFCAALAASARLASLFARFWDLVRRCTLLSSSRSGVVSSFSPPQLSQRSSTPHPSSSLSSSSSLSVSGSLAARARPGRGLLPITFASGPPGMTSNATVEQRMETKRMVQTMAPSAAADRMCELANAAASSTSTLFPTTPVCMFFQCERM